MPTLTVEELMESLPEVLKKTQEGEAFLVTQNNIAVARLMPPASDEKQKRPPRAPGSARSRITYIADDFDVPLEDFAEYM